MARVKVTVVGAGNVGGTAAQRLAQAPLDLGEVAEEITGAFRQEELLFKWQACPEQSRRESETSQEEES